MNGSFDNNDQFVISYELLQLFKWLFENEQETLKKLIERALANGLDSRISQRVTQESSQEDLQQSIIDFFALLETLLYELTSENEIKKIVEKNLMPSINQIDSKACDQSILAASVNKASSVWENNPEQNPKDILCRELLKRWKPSKKIEIN